MNKIAHDIRLTLMIKFLLLMVLWVVCFKGAVKNPVSMQKWLYGSSVDVPGKKTQEKREVKHDSRH